MLWAAGVAIAAASGDVSIALSVACLAGALSLQLVSNLANDLFDHLNGADTAARLGPDRATANGWVSVRQMAVATIGRVATDRLQRQTCQRRAACSPAEM